MMEGVATGWVGFTVMVGCGVTMGVEEAGGDGGGVI